MVVGRLVLTPIRWVFGWTKALVVGLLGTLWTVLKGVVTRPVRAVLSPLNILWGPVQWLANVTKSTTLAVAILIPLVVGFASIGLGIAIAAVWLVVVAKRRLEVDASA